MSIPAVRRQRLPDDCMEASLPAEERLFQAVFMAMDEGALLKNRNGDIVAVNPAAETILGFAAADLIGRSPAECAQLLGFLHEDGLPLPAERHPAMLALETGKAQRGMLMGAHRPDGTVVWLSVSAQPLVSDGEPAPYAVAIIFRDVTAQKSAELERQAYARSLECMNRINRAIQGATDLEQMLSDVLDVVLDFFACDRAFLLNPCDPDAAEWRVPMERTRPEYPGALARGVAVPMDAEVAEILRLTLAMGRPLTFGPGGDRPTPSGLSKKFGIRSQMTTALFPRLGKPWQFGIHQCSHARTWTRDELALFEEIGCRLSDALTGLLMYRRLQASELEFRTLAENLPDNLVRYDREGRRIYVNPALERTAGVTAAQMLGKTLWENNPTNMPMVDRYRSALQHTLATGERSEFEIPIALPGQSGHTHLCFIAAERSADGGISGAIAVSRDITELKRHRHHLERLVEERTLALSSAKETAEAATRAKTRFLAAASHDLRQPLQAIQLFGEALARTELDDRQKKISRHLSTSVTSLGDLLNKLLDISRLDAGTIEPHPVVIQADDLLGAMSAEFDAMSEEKKLRLNLFCPRRGLALFSDGQMLRTILRNLVGNAVKYTTRGGVLVSIRPRAGRALVQVWDTGIGIAADQTDAIFEEYVQVANPERDRTKGVGLGLSIVRRLSNLLDLRVRVHSREGKGSVFEFEVPLAGAPNAQPSPLAASADLDEAASDRLAGKRFVVVEDDAMAAEAIRLSLDMYGAGVTLFGTAEAALGSAEAFGADCYISDYRLPGMDGLQLLETIQHRSAGPIKAVLLTGDTSPHQIELAKRSRWPLVFKPADMATVLSILGS